MTQLDELFANMASIARSLERMATAVEVQTTGLPTLADPDSLRDALDPDEEVPTIGCPACGDRLEQRTPISPLECFGCGALFDAATCPGCNMPLGEGHEPDCLGKPLPDWTTDA